MKTKNLYIIDGNAYLYRSFYAIPHLNNSKGLPTNAVYGFLKILFKILAEKMQPEDAVCVCFDASRKTFRNDIYTEYKSHRDKMPDDLVPQIPLIKEALKKMGIKFFEKEGYEADDLIATIATRGSKLVDVNFEIQEAENAKGADGFKEHGRSREEKQGIVSIFNVKIISSDKDILQVVDENIQVLPLPKEDEVDVKYFEDQFLFPPKNMIDYLSIMGDSSDNVPGVKGIGKKGAQEIISEYKNIDNVLANIDKLKPSFQAKIKDSLDNLKLSKKLITLDTKVPIDFSLEECSFDGFSAHPEFKDFLQDLEFYSIAKKLYGDEGAKPESKNVNIRKKHINFTEKLIFDEKDYKKFDRVCITFSEDIETLYISNFTEFLYKIMLDDFHFYRQQILQLFENINFVLTDNAKNLYAFFQKNDINYKNIEIFDVLLAGYVLDTSVQSTDILLQRFLASSEYIAKNEIFYKLCTFSDVYEVLHQKLKLENLIDDYFDVDLPFCEVLASVEKNGVKLDLGQLEKFDKQIDVMINKLVVDIYDQVGEVFNINSPKQLSNILFNKLNFPVIKKNKTGYSTSEDVLEELAKTSDFPKKILKYRGLMKLKTTYIEPLKRLVDFKGRIHTTYNFTKTTTGRLSSVNPNLQNIPVKKEISSGIRKAFIGDEGCVLVSADYSQIDLAMLAHTSGDVSIRKAFLEGVDIHSWVASLIFKKDINLIDQKERTVAKQINFGIIYGKGAYALSEDLDISIKQAQEFIDLYFETFPKLRSYFENLIDEAKKKGYVTTIFGRKRYIPELNDRNVRLQKQGERLVKNTPIQGSSADVLKKAMVDLYREFSDKEDDIKMLLQIHDEILFEVKEDIASSIIPKIKDIMENTVKLAVPLKVNINLGKNWAELIPFINE